MIFLHELGHFVVARLCRVKVLEFALGMGPKILYYTSKKSGTVYSLRLLPIGGFCSMLGEDRGDDETLDADPHAFCARPAYQRFFVLIAGAGMNLISALLAMCLVLGISGTYTSTTVSGFYSPSYAAGLQIGDVITHANETAVFTKEDVEEVIASLGEKTVTFTVNRDGESVVLQEAGLLMKYVDGAFVRTADFVLSGEGDAPTTVTAYSVPSANAGLRRGDKILKINKKTVRTITDATWEISLSANRPCTLSVLRTNEDASEEIVEISNLVFPVTSENSILLGMIDFGVEQQPVGNVFSVISKAFSECVSTGKTIYRSFVEMVAGRFGTEALSGPIGAAQTISEMASYGIVPLTHLFVMISINLGLFNLFPLPALDGGRLIFVILEMIRRKPVNPKYEAVIHAVGMVLLLALMAVVGVMDVVRLIGG